MQKGSAAARNTVYIGLDGKILLIDTNVHAQTAGGDIARYLDDLGVPRRGQV